MSRVSTLVIGSAIVAACGVGDRQSAPPDSSLAVPVAVETTTTLPAMTGTIVGCFRIGMSVTNARDACPPLTDTIVEGLEGMMVRELRIGVADGGLVARVEGDTVRRMLVTDPRWRTVDSLGVGTELDELLARPGATAIEGEGRLFVTIPSRCGLSFRLDARRGAAVESIDELVRTVLQRNTLVDQVLVIGCPQ